jgi:MFS family permease
MGNMNLYALRINFSVAVVPMSDIFDWTPEQRGFALGAFFYGYISTQIFGGYMAARYGGTIVRTRKALIKILKSNREIFSRSTGSAFWECQC